MYSPKIREDLVHELYKVAKKRRVYMTTLVNGYLEKALAHEKHVSSRNPSLNKQTQSSTDFKQK